MPRSLWKMIVLGLVLWLIASIRLPSVLRSVSENLTQPQKVGLPRGRGAGEMPSIGPFELLSMVIGALLVGAVVWFLVRGQRTS
jgi:hypothetical protein